MKACEFLFWSGRRPALFLCVYAAVLSACAQTPRADFFNPGADGSVIAMAVQTDGKILVGGEFNNLGGQSRPYLGRLLSNGALDAGFNPAANGRVNCLAVLSDGQILVGGNFTKLAGQDRKYLARLTEEGELDPSFAPELDGEVLCLAVQSDGAILVGGWFSTLSGWNRSCLGRFQADGRLDLAFNPQAPGGVQSVALQADGKIIVGGAFYSLAGQNRPFLGRLNSNGSLDLGFSPGAGAEVECLAVQTDGKILVGGRFDTLSGGDRSKLGRLNPDGTLDATFDPGANDVVKSLALQADGSVLVGGWFTRLGGQTRAHLGRLQATGTLDSGFDPGADSWVESLALQADGKILVGGLFGSLGGATRSHLGRLTNTVAATQALSFDGSRLNWARGGASPEVWRARFEFSPEGTLWIDLGEGQRTASGWELAGVPLPAESTFRARGATIGGLGGGSTWLVESITGLPVILSQPVSCTNDPNTSASLSVYAGGSLPLTYQWRKDEVDLVDGGNVSGASTALLTLNRVSGSDEGGYSVVVSNGLGWVESATATLTVRDPQILTQPASMTCSAGNPATFTVSASGTAPLYYQWRKDGLDLKDGSNVSGARQATLRLIRAFGPDAGRYCVVVSNAIGSVISAEATLTVMDPLITAQPAGQGGQAGGSATLCVGAAGTPPLSYQWRKEGEPQLAATQRCLALTGLRATDAGRYDVVVSNPWGSATSSAVELSVNMALPDLLDPAPDSAVRTLALQSDGKIVLGGAFVALGAQSRSRIARLHPDGSLDLSFDPGADDLVNSLAIQADGKILVGGNFYALGGGSRTFLGRLQPDGTLDASFKVAADASVDSLALQADGKILVGGHFSRLGGQTCNRIGRLSSEGILDGGFNPGTDAYVVCLAQQPDGKILVGGYFRTLGGQAHSYLGRLGADGQPEADFNPSPDSYVYCLVLQPDGKIVVGGNFTTLAGQTRSHLGRLNPDGTADQMFNPGASGRVFSLALQADGKIVVAGAFATLGGQSRQNLGRLEADGTLDKNFNPGVAGQATALALQTDGKLVVGGDFTSLAGQGRARLGRLANTAPAEQRLAYDGSTLTWTRAGPCPEIAWARFQNSYDGGASWNDLGLAQRVGTGWQVSGLAYPTNTAFRAYGYAAGGVDDASGWFAESVLRPPLMICEILWPTDGRFGFTATGPAGATVVIESSPDLSTWTSLQTNRIGTDGIQFLDPQPMVGTSRLYRLRSAR